MALFSRRKKSDDAVSEAAVDPTESTVEERLTDDAPAEPAPTVAISVQAFRGVGAAAGPEVALPSNDASVEQSGAATASTGSDAGTATAPAGTAPANRTASGNTTANRAANPAANAAPKTPAPRTLPLAPALPPEQTESVAGMKDNVLLREALAQLTEGATNEHYLGVLRQALQSHLFLRVNGDARQQISEGGQLSIAVVRDGDRSYMLAFSSAAAVRAAVQREESPIATTAVAQPSTAVLQQAVDGGFTGLILDNASAPHRAVFPIEVLAKALEQADPDMTVKNLISQPRQADTAAQVGQALGTTKMWVAVNEGGDGRQAGIAEAQTPDGRRFLQLFTHPLEVVSLGRGDRPLPFSPQQLAKVLSTHSEIAGVLVDAAGPSIIVERDALAPVLVHAVDLGD